MHHWQHRRGNGEAKIKVQKGGDDPGLGKQKVPDVSKVRVHWEEGSDRLGKGKSFGKEITHTENEFQPRPLDREERAIKADP